MEEKKKERGEENTERDFGRENREEKNEKLEENRGEKNAGDRGQKKKTEGRSQVDIKWRGEIEKETEGLHQREQISQNKGGDEESILNEYKNRTKQRSKEKSYIFIPSALPSSTITATAPHSLSLKICSHRPLSLSLGQPATTTVDHHSGSFSSP